MNDLDDLEEMADLLKPQSTRRMTAKLVKSSRARAQAVTEHAVKASQTIRGRCSRSAADRKIKITLASHA